VKNVTTYVGIDAHKKDLFFAMLIGSQMKPVTWTIANEPNAIRRVVRKLERERRVRSARVMKRDPAGMRCSGS
jgi:hypothetical protein